MTRRQVGILIFPDVEVLHFCGPFEVFSVTRFQEAESRNVGNPWSCSWMMSGSNAAVPVCSGDTYLTTAAAHTLQVTSQEGPSRPSPIS
jgi:hypothetical protein